MVQRKLQSFTVFIFLSYIYIIIIIINITLLDLDRIFITYFLLNCYTFRNENNYFKI